MLTLAFDTTTFSLSVALLSDQKTLANNIIFESRKQSELLITEIEKVLHSQKIWYQDLDLIAATGGPGSFTGTRIGITAARIIKLAIDVPLILVNSCEVLAFKYRKHSGKIFVALDAANNELFFAEFFAQNEAITQITETQLISYAELSKNLPADDFFLCGIKNGDMIEAELVGLLAYEKFSNSEISQNFAPLYLREPRITERKK